MSRAAPSGASALLAAALAAAACSGSSGDADRGNGAPPAEDAPRDATITAAVSFEWTSYNNNTGEQNSTGNSEVLNQVLRGFWFYGADGLPVPDTDVGTYTKTSDDPLTVVYEIAEGARWSDGEPLDCDDLVLTWAANSGRYAFSSAGTTGYERMQAPGCEDGDRTMEAVYATPYADWQLQFGAGSLLPAHVVEQEAGVEDLVAAVRDDDRPALDRAAEFYNHGWELVPGEMQPDLMPSLGPYRVTGWQPAQSVTLTAEPAWWGEPAATRTIVLRLVPGDEQVPALVNGEVQVGSPTPNRDLIGTLESAGDRLVLLRGEMFGYEHLDFNLSGAFGNLDLRRAFAMCVPRRQILDALVRPVNEDMEVLNSRWYLPSSPGYGQVVAASYDGRYDTPDVEGAREILETNGAVGTVVRVGYQVPFRRWKDVTDLVAGSCSGAGFDVRHDGQPDFFGRGLRERNFDVALFAWLGAPAITDSSSTFTTGGGNNNGGYSDGRVDALVAQLDTTSDLDEQIDLVTRIETILWEDVPTIPLYAFPGVVAHSRDVEGVTFQPSQSGVTWNMHEWRLAE